MREPDRDGVEDLRVDIGGIGLAICTDGVGSKAIIARMMNRYAFAAPCSINSF
jgi:hypothetical protein